MSTAKKATRSFTEGPLFFRILLFTLPLMATALLFIDATNPDATAILDYAMQMLRIMLATSFLNGTWQMLSGAVRGMGYSFSAMVISLFGAAFFRVFWILVIFPLEPMHNIPGLFTVFPFSWTITGIMLVVNVFVAYRKLKHTVKVQ